MTAEILALDHLTFYVSKPEFWRDWFCKVWGFVRVGMQAVQSGNVTFVIVDQPEYLSHHPAGVGDLCFVVKDLAAVRDLPEVQILSQTAEQITIRAIADVTHTFVQTPQFSAQTAGFMGLDHVVFNVPTGTMTELSAWYQKNFGWSIQAHYQISGEHTALRSCVLVNATGTVQIPLNESASPHSQVQEFLEHNRGAGVQHVALGSGAITDDVRRLRERGVKFLMATAESDLDAGILIDRHPQYPEQYLLQIFTQPIFGEPTFFFELIQRCGQRQGFGEANFRALFTAIEQEQQRSLTAPLAVSKLV